MWKYLFRTRTDRTPWVFSQGNHPGGRYQSLGLVLLLVMPLVAAQAASSILGPPSICTGTTNTFTISTDSTNAAYAWSISSSNSAAASILSDTNAASVELVALTDGEFNLECAVDSDGTNEVASVHVVVLGLISGSALSNQSACLGDTVIFSTTVSGGGYSVVWRKDGGVIGDAITEMLVLTNVGGGSAGLYSVEVSGPCNGFTNSATLEIIPPASINCPTSLSLQCLTDLPPPDTNAVFATGAVSVVFLGDVTVTNGCELTVARTYGAVNSCGNISTCIQMITVLDTTPPVVSCAANLTVEWGTAWDFTPPTITDNCDGTNLTAIITGTTTNQLCGQTVEVTRTWLVYDVCQNSASCSQTVTVRDTTPPLFAGSSNQVVECGTAWEFIPPLVTDIADGTNVVLVITATSTNALCGNTLEATQVWSATDSCTNTAYFTQTVTVQDTTAPVPICPANRIVECGESWDFGTPTATDVCGGTNVIIAVVNTVTNPLVGETFSATRTWSFTDACSNSNTCSQTITILDTTPPQIFCSSNIVVECAGPAGTPVSFVTTAMDGCDSNVTVVCIPPSGYHFTLGTNIVLCVATDDSGNTNQCSFEVVVVDTTPPLIACPAHINAAESPRDSGSAAVPFPNAATSDICDDSLVISASPVSGSIFPVGTNAVTWTAVDGSGNSNSCTFTIRVIPYRLAVTTTADSGEGSLRKALLDANDSPDENYVYFNLPGSGPHVIRPASPLPDVTSPVIIDGWSQSGTNAPPMIALDGSLGTNTFDGLVIRAGNSVVRGLAWHHFATAIRIEDGGSNSIFGNFIGTDTTGTNAPGNTADGVFVASARNRIGSSATGTGNLISGNAGNGITLASTGANSNAIQGNFIGVALDGLTPTGNSGHGIWLTDQASRNLIGGQSNGTPNVIAFNGAAGVALNATSGSRNAIQGNLITANAALGIDLGADGITPNDALDADTGPNELQNFPILSDARSVAGVTVIDGGMSGTPNTTFRLEFFLNNVADPSTNGEGRLYLGSTSVSVGDVGTQTFSANFPITAVFTQFVTATATDPQGNTSEFSPAVRVRTPPVIEVQPVGTNATAGGSVTFCVTASGTPPILYQWRKNGVNIPGATNPCYTITSAVLADGGSYSVVVGNVLGASSTTSASLLLTGGGIVLLPPGDNFVDRVPVYGKTGTVASVNTFATVEPGEPQHAGKPGGRSVWYTWSPPVKGIATLRTSGSTFDTLLAVYRVKEGWSSRVTNLVAEASDEDRGGFYSSSLRFNALKNKQYHFAIDALGGFGGEFILDWSEISASHLLPEIRTNPVSQTVFLGSNVTFNVYAVPVCGNDGHSDCWVPGHYEDDQAPHLYYQWYFEGQPIPGAESAFLTITNVQPENLGNYYVNVSTRHQDVDSQDAVLQINITGTEAQQAQAFDKFLDASLLGTPLFIGAPGLIPDGLPLTAEESIPVAAAGTIVRGYSGSQIFNTSGSAGEPGEVICGVVGGASEWITFVADQAGTLFLNTDGSTYDTVMAVFQRNPTNAAALQLLTCDNDGGADGRDSSVALPVQNGGTNYVVVDGVNGAAGTLRLNYSLATTTILKILGQVQGANQIQLTGHPNQKYTLQASTNFVNWTALVTTNTASGVFIHTDAESVNLPRRYYRALLLP